MWLMKHKLKRYKLIKPINKLYIVDLFCCFLYLCQEQKSVLAAVLNPKMSKQLKDVAVRMENKQSLKSISRALKIPLEEVQKMAELCIEIYEEGIKECDEPATNNIFDFESIEDIVRMGLNETVSSTGVSKKDVIQQLKEYLATNKPKLQQFKEFLGLRDDDDDDDDKEIEEEEEEEELQAFKQHSRNVKVLTFMELTTQYTKDELDQRFDHVDGRLLFKHYNEFFESIENMIQQEEKPSLKPKTGGLKNKNKSKAKPKPKPKPKHGRK
ncbi:hypothetical protein Tco_1369664 [Tanacetum coccineum]